MSTIYRTRSIAPITLSPAQERLAWHERSELPADVSALKSSGTPIRSYGCGKGLSIAAPTYEMPDISGFRGSAHRMNPRGPLRSHLGFNRGSFSFTSPIGVEVALPIGGGRRG